MPRVKADHRHRVMSWDAAKVSRTWRPKTRAKRSRTHRPSQDAERASQDAVAATASQDALPTSRDAQSVPGRSRHVPGTRAGESVCRRRPGHLRTLRASRYTKKPSQMPGASSDTRLMSPDACTVPRRLFNVRDAPSVLRHPSTVPGRYKRPETPLSVLRHSSRLGTPQFVPRRPMRPGRPIASWTQHLEPRPGRIRDAVSWDTKTPSQDANPRLLMIKPVSTRTVEALSVVRC